MEIPVCAVTGRIAGDHMACGDCDPCGAAYRVPDVVKRLLEERDEWANQFSSAATEVDVMREALQAAQNAEEQAMNCEEHEPEMAPESCAECFPLADEARLKRWEALKINQPTPETAT